MESAREVSVEKARTMPLIEIRPEGSRIVASLAIQLRLLPSSEESEASIEDLLEGDTPLKLMVT